MRYIDLLTPSKHTQRGLVLSKQKYALGVATSQHPRGLEIATDQHVVQMVQTQRPYLLLVEYVEKHYGKLDLLSLDNLTVEWYPIGTRLLIIRNDVGIEIARSLSEKTIYYEVV